MSWINNMLQPNGADWWQSTGVGTDVPSFDGGVNAGTASGPYGGGADGYRPAWWGSAASNGSSPAGSTSTNGMLAQIMAMVEQLTGSIGGAFGGTGFGGNGYAGNGYGGTGYGGNACGGATPPQPGAATFANATLSSTGDPHLALTGTLENANGTTTQVNDHYDNMSSQRDLLSTNDFGDAFRVSTTATTPNANGVTYNQSATATMDFGRDRVTIGPGGAVSVTSNGNALALGAGKSVTLAGGEVVSENGSGAVSIAEQNAAGESLTTTFTNNGSGVDVSATANGGVTLGGSLVRHAVNGA
jgi:hypothetical protein